MLSVPRQALVNGRRAPEARQEKARQCAALPCEIVRPLGLAAEVIVPPKFDDLDVCSISQLAKFAGAMTLLVIGKL